MSSMCPDTDCTSVDSMSGQYSRLAASHGTSLNIPTLSLKWRLGFSQTKTTWLHLKHEIRLTLVFDLCFDVMGEGKLMVSLKG